MKICFEKDLKLEKDLTSAGPEKYLILAVSRLAVSLERSDLLYDLSCLSSKQ